VGAYFNYVRHLFRAQAAHPVQNRGRLAGYVLKEQVNAHGLPRGQMPGTERLYARYGGVVTKER